MHMPSGATIRSGPQQPPQPPAPENAASPPNKRDLKSWWKGFKLPTTPEARPQGIFGVPLRQSITYANVAISLIDENGSSYIYGYVPIVVAKCGVFLKEKATEVEGIFRLNGSEKRIKELKTQFDSPDRYGKGLIWDGYTVHDASNVFRRYLNDLPEPVVPLDLYEKFREPLRGATKQASGDAEGPQFVEDFDEQGAIARYQRLITELPPLNRQLLLYILDLLAVFAAKSEQNRMNSQNLAAIFQPGMLSHPDHAMAPEEYRLNQCVLIFLIENQDHFLIGMQGTAADEKTVQEVQQGTPAPADTNSASPSTPTLGGQHSNLGVASLSPASAATAGRSQEKLLEPPLSSLSLASGSGKPRKSFTNDSSDPATSLVETQLTQESGSSQKERSESGKEETTKNPIGWIRNKYREAKETHEQRRNKSPPADNKQASSSTSRLSLRGKSFDLRREDERQGSQPQPSLPPPVVAVVEPPPTQPAQPPAQVGAVVQPDVAAFPDQQAQPEMQARPQAEPEAAHKTPLVAEPTQADAPSTRPE
ncbi:unnamed protein product [Parascedosporium putredinis]|uniref:Rho-GAP domain-containing protein n=1 Tax=Parascedosporium putredinis TaxID=1442378 RepID=A0A9P1HCI7_9PEZI|nr:unnamed protein product [Parascedosporium putredinis]CAI8003095.1 unnamed protein product [Parascedosporium putredinis]